MHAPHPCRPRDLPVMPHVSERVAVSFQPPLIFAGFLVQDVLQTLLVFIGTVSCNLLLDGLDALSQKRAELFLVPYTHKRLQAEGCLVALPKLQVLGRHLELVGLLDGLVLARGLECLAHRLRLEYRPRVLQLFLKRHALPGCHACHRAEALVVSALDVGDTLCLVAHHKGGDAHHHKHRGRYPNDDPHVRAFPSLLPRSFLLTRRNHIRRGRPREPPRPDLIHRVEHRYV
mmetsp:Transcript_21776/g.50255  ORF Transcript_21776/g.50255 Transcript_21776/m.50255 type:complete len:231 (-) Transcript_21776:821-1513(-)